MLSTTQVLTCPETVHQGLVERESQLPCHSDSGMPLSAEVLRPPNDPPGAAPDSGRSVVGGCCAGWNDVNASPNYPAGVTATCHSPRKYSGLQMTRQGRHRAVSEVRYPRLCCRRLRRRAERRQRHVRQPQLPGRRHSGVRVSLVDSCTGAPQHQPASHRHPGALRGHGRLGLRPWLESWWRRRRRLGRRPGPILSVELRQSPCRLESVGRARPLLYRRE